MPTYDYRCQDCGSEFQAFHGIADPAPDCGACGGETERAWVRAPAFHGADARGREAAVNSLPQCGAGCRCCP